MKNNIVTRFPPSPTGWFHVGNARTALFNYFYTKKNNGILKFRLEDTDRERSTNEYANDIIEGLKWLGIDINYSDPYKQSEHSDTYRKYIEKMLNDGTAFISKEEVKEEGQRSEVIRLKNPNKKIVYEDMIRGKIEVDTTELGDLIIAKSLDEPLYHLAVVVDDFEMEVTHIIRGEDGIYNTPRQILIQEAIGAQRPTYAHMPFILNEDRSKLSKRKQGEKVSLKYYREMGILPEAMVNFLAFCGWNPGTNDEVFTMEEIIERFDIMKVQKAGAVFNVEKLLWFNKEHLKRVPIDTLKSKFKEIISKKFFVNDDVLSRITSILLDRINTYGELDTLIKSGEFDYFFMAPVPVKEMLIWKKDTDFTFTKNNLAEVLQILEQVKDWSETNLKTALMPLAEGVGKGSVLWPLRVALSGKEKSPDPFALLTILGQTESIKRINQALTVL